jgi:hypothetical protein
MPLGGSDQCGQRPQDSGFGRLASGIGQKASISFISLISFVSSEMQVYPVWLLRSSDR